MGVFKWLAKQPKNLGILNIFFSTVTLVVCAAFGYILLGWTGHWVAIGQSLIAGAVVSGITVISSTTQYFAVTRNYDLLVALGIRRFRQRGKPGSKWPAQLKAVQHTLIFFGKDHNRLLEQQKETLNDILLTGNATISFYLLSPECAYYKDAPEDEKKERNSAGIALFALKAQVAKKDPLAARKLRIFEYDGTPSFTCTVLDKRIIFGPYLPKSKNSDTPEFEVESGEDTWLYDACYNALISVTLDDKVKEITEVPHAQVDPSKESNNVVE